MNYYYWKIIFALLFYNFKQGFARGTENGMRESFLKLQKTNLNNYMNLKVRPCNDFYEYACGNWEKYQRQYTRSVRLSTLNVAQIELNRLIKILLTNNQGNNRAEKLAKTFYDACMDEKTIERTTMETLINMINKNGGCPLLNKNWSEEKFDLVNVLTENNKNGFLSILHTEIIPDFHNPKSNIIAVLGPKLSLKNRNDYLKEENIMYLQAYNNLIYDVLSIFNVSSENSIQTANEIIDLEIFLTNFSSPSTDYAIKNYKTTTLQNLITNYPLFDWNRYFQLLLGYEIQLHHTIAIINVQSFENYIDAIINIDKRILANYLTWRIIFSLSNDYYLVTEPFLIAMNKFQKVISGIDILNYKSICIGSTVEYLNYVVGSMLIKNIQLDDYSKVYIENIIEQMKKIFYKRIDEVTWLDLETKQEAILKLNSITSRVGYPDVLLNDTEVEKYYANLNFGANYLENKFNADKFEIIKNFAKLNKTLYGNEWEWGDDVTFSDVNAFYNKIRNSITISAGILQPPMYHKFYPSAINYGAIGSFVGHELTHALDTQGKSFDHTGKMRNWWTAESNTKYNERADCFVKFYDSFTIYKKHLNGKFSLAENIADIGGVRLSYAAYKEWLSTATDEELLNENFPKVNFDVEQLFFIGYAQTYCSAKILPEDIENLIETDKHSPNKFRVLGVLQNMPEFAETFNCKLGSPMNPVNKCELW